MREWEGGGKVDNGRMLWLSEGSHWDAERKPSSFRKHRNIVRLGCRARGRKMKDGKFHVRTYSCVKSTVKSGKLQCLELMSSVVSILLTHISSTPRYIIAV